MSQAELRHPSEVVRDAYESPVHALRRDDLERALIFNNIPVPRDPRKDVLLPIVLGLTEGAESDFKFQPDGWRPDNGARALVKPVDYSGYNFIKLRQELKLQGIPFKRTDTKDVLLEKLNGGNPS